MTGQAYQNPKDALNEFASNAADEYAQNRDRREDGAKRATQPLVNGAPDTWIWSLPPAPRTAVQPQRNPPPRSPARIGVYRPLDFSTAATADRALRDRSLAGPAFGRRLPDRRLRRGHLGHSLPNRSRTRLRHRPGRSLRHDPLRRRQMGHARRAASLALGLVIARDLERPRELLAAIRGRGEALGPRDMPLRWADNSVEQTDPLRHWVVILSTPSAAPSAELRIVHTARGQTTSCVRWNADDERSAWSGSAEGASVRNKPLCS